MRCTLEIKSSAEELREKDEYRDHCVSTEKEEKAKVLEKISIKVPR
jgi:hypothetical protein